MRIKVCGITREQDIDQAVDLGVDWIGLNFVPESPRYVSRRKALSLRERITGKTRCVAVTLHCDREWLEWALGELRVDFVQVHAPVGSDVLEELGPRAVRVFHRRPTTEEVRGLGRPAFVLIDAPRRRHVLPGGTGTSWAYGRLAGLELPVPWLVAGGIRPDNVRSALERSGASGVDVASGIERVPGIKDPELMRRLVQEVRDLAQTPRV